jgi:hypothetical protein
VVLRVLIINRIATIIAMKKHTMLCGGVAMVCVNLYGFIISLVYPPPPVAVLVMAVLAAALIVYI